MGEGDMIVVEPSAMRAWWHRRFGHPAVVPYGAMMLCRRCADAGPKALDGTESPEERWAVERTAMLMNRKPLKVARR